MKIWILTIIGIILCGTVSADEVADLIRATCRVRNTSTSGSAVVFGRDAENAYLLTAAHVAKADGFIFFDDRKSKTISYKVVKKSDKFDLAVLQVKASDLDHHGTMPIAHTDVDIDEEIFSAGSPEGGYTTAFRGYVTNKYESFTEITPSIIPGRSGSGVCTKNGLVGIVLRYTKQTGQLATLAQIREFLESEE